MPFNVKTIQQILGNVNEENTIEESISVRKKVEGIGAQNVPIQYSNIANNTQTNLTNWTP
ncbi:MAG: hypothetical protein MJA29_03825 [Candidatus Omnitrophica bacterium]|nr:hypothetical protein [Candidatus Omnitrophota bacterium]